ncbi:MAG: efflux RND transporter permease subunit [Deferribacteraceae bacterium]|jgi:HAE1 family hydrophobic/amphiphilic exporter-1|nr:efflux RND transporter permease subunit [Deferribacteraceae bacterium]
MNFIKFAIVRPTAVAVLFIILVVFGIFSSTALKQELVPRITLPYILVSAVYPGANATEVETSVTKKLEDAVSSLEGIKNINSRSQENLAIIFIEFQHGTDTTYALINANQKISAIKRTLPDTLEEPSVSSFNMNDMPVINLGVTSLLSSVETRDLVKNEIQPLIENIPGVASVTLNGGSEREIQVNIYPDRLYAYNLSILEVTQAINSSNLDFPAGKLKNESGQTTIRLSGKYASLKDIEDIVVSAGEDGTVKLGEIAKVEDTVKEKTNITRLDGKDALGISILKREDANTVAVAHGTLALITDMELRYRAEGLKFTVASNAADFTEAATASVIEDLILAIILVSLAMLIFLHSFRNMLIVAVAIPVSLVSTFTAMLLLNFTLNLLSLMALSLVVGILVDDAIVVIENIHRHMEMGKSAGIAVFDAMKEIAGTVMSITLVIVVVFVPISVVNNMVAELFRQFALVVAIATLLSLLVSFTIVPTLTARFGKLAHYRKGSFAEKASSLVERGIGAFSNLITDILNWALAHKIAVSLLTFILFAGSLSLLPFKFIGTEFASAGDRSEFYIKLELPQSATLEETETLTRKAENIIREHPLMTPFYSTIGASDYGIPQANRSEILVKLVDKDKRTLSDRELAINIKTVLQEKLVGAKYTIALSNIMGGADDSPIQVIVKGDNIEEAHKRAAELLKKVAVIQGVTDAKLSADASAPEMSIVLNKEKMLQLGVGVSQFGNALYNAFAGNTDSKYQDGKYEYDINIRYADGYRRLRQDLTSFELKNNYGEQVKAIQFASFEDTQGQVLLERHNRRSSVTVSAQTLGRTSGEIGADVRQAVAELGLERDVEYGGDMSMQTEGFQTLGLALLVSVILSYLILVALYNSFFYPFVTIAAVPLSFIGALLALALTQETLSILSMLGFIMLTGLVIKNAVIVVDFANTLKENGASTREALVKSVRLRFRPVLMTTLSMIIGMLPIALATGDAAEWKNGIGCALIGGLISSMFLTMIIVPLIYEVFDNLLIKLHISTERKKVVLEEI